MIVGVNVSDHFWYRLTRIMRDWLVKQLLLLLLLSNDISCQKDTMLQSLFGIHDEGDHIRITYNNTCQSTRLMQSVDSESV